jgi:hypothetical protein
MAKKTEQKRAAIYALIEPGDTAGVKVLQNYCRKQGWDYLEYVDAEGPGNKQIWWKDLLGDIAIGDFYDFVVLYQDAPGFEGYCTKYGTQVVKVDLETEVHQ